jgi:hypothetical protein
MKLPEPGFPQTTLGGGKRARPSPSDVLFTAFHIPPAAGGTLNVLVACVNKIQKIKSRFLISNQILKLIKAIQ